jgi:hypothetical protein
MKTSLEIVINIEEKWHLDLLANSSQQLQNLTLTLRSSSTTKVNHAHDDNNGCCNNTSICNTSRNNNNVNLETLTKLIGNMHHLKNLRIYSEIHGNFLLKSLSIEDLVVQGRGMLHLKECICPRLKRIDVAFYAENVRHDHIFFKCMSPSVEELILRIEQDCSSCSCSRTGMVDASWDSSDGRDGLDAYPYEEELQKLLLLKMVRLKKLTLLLSAKSKCNLVAAEPSSPKSVVQALDSECIRP